MREGVFAYLCLVDGGERAVIWDRFQGIKPDVIGEGTHFLIPGIQRPRIFDVRTKPRSIQTTTGSKGKFRMVVASSDLSSLDLQMVNITVRVLSKPHVEQLPRILTRLGVDFDERVLPSIGNEVLKATVALYDAGELITKREQVRFVVQRHRVLRAY